MRLNGKTALMTGAARGIEQAFAAPEREHLAAQTYNVDGGQWMN